MDANANYNFLKANMGGLDLNKNVTNRRTILRDGKYRIQKYAPDFFNYENDNAGSMLSDRNQFKDNANARFRKTVNNLDGVKKISDFFLPNMLPEYLSLELKKKIVEGFKNNENLKDLEILTPTDLLNLMNKNGLRELSTETENDLITKQSAALAERKNEFISLLYDELLFEKNSFSQSKELNVNIGEIILKNISKEDFTKKIKSMDIPNYRDKYFNFTEFRYHVLLRLLEPFNTNKNYIRDSKMELPNVRKNIGDLWDLNSEASDIFEGLYDVFKSQNLVPSGMVDLDKNEKMEFINEISKSDFGSLDEGSIKSIFTDPDKKKKKK
jgi:hypothetical protein